MTSNLASEKVANDYANAVRQDGGHVFRVMPAGVLIAALSMIGSPNALARLRTIAEEQQDTLERIATEYPSAVEPCKCSPNGSCPKCEIAYLLNEWQQAHEPDQPLTTEEEYWTKRGFPATRLSRIARAAANL